MPFISSRWIEAIALSAIFLIALFNNTVRADQPQTLGSDQGGSSTLKIKGPSTDTAASESEKDSSGSSQQTSSDASPPTKQKLSPQRQAATRHDGATDKSLLQQPQQVLEQQIPNNSLSKKKAEENDTKVGESFALKDQPSAPVEDAELKPIPTTDQSGPAALEAASFKGVTPGATTIEEVEKAWGPSKEIFKQNNLMMQLFSVSPFDRVEVSYQQDVVSSIVIRFQQSFAANAIAQQLDLAAIKPVLVSNEKGEVLGQVYPERGVLFAFEPSPDNGKPSMKVTHIILEPLNAEPFILRAETELDKNCDLSVRDLEEALHLQPTSARTQWLLARAFLAMDKLEKADAASAEAVRLEPDNPRYRITRAQILGQLGRLQAAVKEAEKSLETSKDLGHIQARALNLLGDLVASGPNPDYRKAINYHTQAVQIADSLANDPHPAIRLAVKETLVEAHLGAVHDIAWGDYKEKENAIKKWLERAAAFADDYVKNEGGSGEVQFHVCTRALSACVGARGKIDPQPWIQEAQSKGKELIDAAADPLQKAHYQWELGMALYDAVQIYQMRSDHETALKYAEAAVEYLEQGYPQKQTLTAAYILGRLYFRLGAIQAIRNQYHEQAVVWFEKAVPLLMKSLPPEAATDLGRQGEIFISMGVSYWETKQQDKALKLTQHGIALLEKAHQQGLLDQAALVVPYSNLAAMHRQLGDAEDAERYQKLAAKIKNSQVK